MSNTKKYLLSIISLIIFYNIANAQKVSLISEGTFGFLSHNSIRDFHNELKTQILLQGIKTTDDFSYNYGFNIGIKFNTIKTSLVYSNRVSGAKSSLSDFSGLIRLQNELKGSTLGIIYEPFEYGSNKFKFVLGFKGLITSSDFSTEITSIILEESTNENLDFSSVDIGLGAIASINYDLKYLILRAHLDFDFYLSGKLKFKDIDDAHLLNETGDNVTTDWTGLNLNLGIIVPIIK